MLCSSMHASFGDLMANLESIQLKVSCRCISLPSCRETWHSSISTSQWACAMHLCSSSSVAVLALHTSIIQLVDTV